MTTFARLLNFDIESYLVFQEDVNNACDGAVLNYGASWAEIYLLTRVDFNNNDDVIKLAGLWHQAYPNCLSINDAKRTVERMYARGSLCFAALHEDAYVGMVWLGNNSNFMFNRIGAFLKQEVNKAVYHHIYVAPDARGSNLQGGLRLLALNSARKRGANNIYAFVGCKNFSSIKNFIGFSSKYKLIYHIAIDIGPLKLNFHPKLSIEKWVSIEDPIRFSR